MPSSTSSSESLRRAGRRASPPERAVPFERSARVVVLALAVGLAALAGWELYWRSQAFVPSYRNDDGLWVRTHARIEREGPGGTAVVGSSRVLFDLNLETWRDVTGELPVQLALEGTNPRPFLRHLARETDFAGLLVVGVTPGLFFSERSGLRSSVLEYLRSETIAERVSERLSLVALEPYLAFYDPETALFTVLRRQAFWPERSGKAPALPEVRKLSNLRITRQADMWERVASDRAYREIARSTWLAFLNAPRPPPPPEDERLRRLDAWLDAVAEDVRAIRARGGEVVFVRPPSSGPFREAERGGFPRERHWDALLRRTGSVGVHFEDHDDLMDVELPEWSHVRASDTPRFTRALVARLRDALEAAGRPREELAP